MSDTAQNHVWEAMRYIRQARASIAKAYEECQEDNGIEELVNFASTSAIDAQYFLSAATRRIRELQNKVPDDINAEEKG